VVDGDGEVTDFLRLPHIMKRRSGWNRDDAALKVANGKLISFCHCNHISVRVLIFGELTVENCAPKLRIIVTKVITVYEDK